MLKNYSNNIYYNLKYLIYNDTINKMKLKNTMIIVTDINKSVEFYKNILELNVVMDFGANKRLNGNLVLQTK